MEVCLTRIIPFDEKAKEKAKKVLANPMKGKGKSYAETVNEWEWTPF